MKTEEIHVENVECNSCVRAIKNTLTPIKGVISVDVNAGKSIVEIKYDNLERSVITNALDLLGYPEVRGNKDKITTHN